MTKLPLNILILIFTIVSLLLGLFYFQLDGFIDVQTINILLVIYLVLCLSLFILTLIRAFNNHIKPFLFFIITVGILLLFSFKHLIGWIQFNFNESDRKTIVSNINSGFYDSIIAEEKYFLNEAWIENHKPRFKIFKDSTLHMVFLWQDHMRTQEEYCGQLYISDLNQIENPKVSNFLAREFRKKYLGDNWFWVDCYIDRSPGP